MIYTKNALSRVETKSKIKKRIFNAVKFLAIFNLDNELLKHAKSKLNENNGQLSYIRKAIKDIVKRYRWEQSGRLHVTLFKGKQIPWSNRLFCRLLSEIPSRTSRVVIKMDPWHYPVCSSKYNTRKSSVSVKGRVLIEFDNETRRFAPMKPFKGTSKIFSRRLNHVPKIFL